MMKRVFIALLSLIMVLVGQVAVDPGSEINAQVAGDGDLLAALGRQVARVSPGAVRPRVLTQIPIPANAEEVAVHPSGASAIVVVSSPFGSNGNRGADLISLDMQSETLTPLVRRASASESLTSPSWWPNGDGLLFQRDDLSSPPLAAPGQEVARYSSRIDAVNADGSGRTTLQADGRHPGAAPDGVGYAFVRGSSTSAALLVGSRIDAGVRQIVPTGQFPDLGYPRFSPDGATIAFTAPQSAPVASRGGIFRFLDPPTVYAHGIPWDVWLVGSDGGNLRRIAQPDSDEPSVTWSPDGSRLLVFGGSGSWIVNLADGKLQALPRITGYGVVSWLPQ